MDALYVGVVVIFFLLTLGLVAMCERLGREKSGGKP